MIIDVDQYITKNGNMGALDAIRKDYDLSDPESEFVFKTEMNHTISIAFFRYLIENRIKYAYSVEHFVSTTKIETSNEFNKRNFDKAIDITIRKWMMLERGFKRVNADE